MVHLSCFVQNFLGFNTEVPPAWETPQSQRTELVPPGQGCAGGKTLKQKGAWLILGTK